MYDYAKKHEIEGYASRTSVDRGDNIQFFVSTIDPTYQLDVYRMGWYGGAGARLMKSFASLPGKLQVRPKPGALGFFECTWTNPVTLSIPKDADPTVWTSGTYLVKLTGAKGKQSYIPFVVRDDARSSDIFFVANVNTYQAYNNWGGRSLYPQIDPDGIAAQRISFNRPYANDLGAGQFLGWEYNMVRFLEREGFDVTYATNVDVHENLALLEQHSVFLDTGHDEYWSWEMRINLERALANGESLAFFAGNVCWWQIRYDASPATGIADRTIIAYKDSYRQDPYFNDGNSEHRQRTTFLWDSTIVNRPAALLEGIEYFAGAKTRDMVIQDTSFFAFDGTTLTPGSRIPGVVGGEVDHRMPSSPANLHVLAATPVVSEDGSDYANMAAYTADSGAIVLATGSFQFSWGLDSYALDGTHPSYENAEAEAFAKNALYGMVHRH